MKKLKRLICIIILGMIIISSGQVFANTGLNAYLGEMEISEDYENWEKLSEEDKKNVLPPRSYEIRGTSVTYNNPIKIANTVGSATLSKYTLQDYIPENLVIKNQEETASCWAFASLAMLESNIALSDYYNKKSPVEYDFSERHMVYATTREFKDGEINLFGLNRLASEGANYYISRTYLTNGMGPIAEKDMPFENNQDLIALSEIQGKKVIARLYDTIEFPTLEEGANTDALIKDMKNHITKNGGIEAGIYGADLETNYYNPLTGAIYTDDAKKAPANHDVVIIGWDDDYAIENFNEECRPQNKGAWIVKNSWGTEAQVTGLKELKEQIFKQYNDKCLENGWESAEEIPNAFLEAAYKDTEYFVKGDYLYMKIGIDGFMYVSYEDANIYYMLTGVEKAATDGLDYHKLYQYDEQGAGFGLSLKSSNVYLANTFKRDNTKKEYLSEVAIAVAEATTCKVYVNPNGPSKDYDDLVLVDLVEGKSESISAGYHTLEFLNPIELTSDQFTVVVELEGKTPDQYLILLECNKANSEWAYTKVEDNMCFWSVGDFFKKSEWGSLSTLTEESGGSLYDGDTTIKAFTVSELKTPVVEKIEITTPPTKTEYEEGQDFDKTGMVVTATYNDKTTAEIKDYTIQNGTKLKLDQETVIIEYKGLVATQKITVKEKTTNNDDDDDKKVTAESTDFTNAKATAKNIKTYYFTKGTNKDYITMNIELSKITRKNNDTYEYYYYLSSNPSKTDIKDWIKVTNKQTIQHLSKYSNK